MVASLVRVGRRGGGGCSGGISSPYRKVRSACTQTLLLAQPAARDCAADTPGQQSASHGNANLKMAARPRHDGPPLATPAAAAFTPPQPRRATAKRRTASSLERRIALRTEKTNPTDHWALIY